MVFCCYSEDSWEKTAADLSDVEAAAAATGAASASGNDISHTATPVSGKIPTDDDPTSVFTDAAQCISLGFCIFISAK